MSISIRQGLLRSGRPCGEGVTAPGQSHQENAIMKVFSRGGADTRKAPARRPRGPWPPFQVRSLLLPWSAREIHPDSGRGRRRHSGLWSRAEIRPRPGQSRQPDPGVRPDCGSWEFSLQHPLADKVASGLVSRLHRAPSRRCEPDRQSRQRSLWCPRNARRQSRSRQKETPDRARHPR